MSEKADRKVALAHRELVARSMALVRKYGDYISTDEYTRASDFDPDSEDGASITFDGDVATLHFIASGRDAPYASSFDFIAATLWDRSALAAAIKARRKERADARAARLTAQAERERQEYERLRRRFEPTGDLRQDIEKAMAVEAVIAREEALK